jgi:hypothetical protein
MVNLPTKSSGARCFRDRPSSPEFVRPAGSTHPEPIDPRDWTQARSIPGSRSRLPIFFLTAQSSEKSDACGALAVEPAATRLLGKRLQRSDRLRPRRQPRYHAARRLAWYFTRSGSAWRMNVLDHCSDNYT